LKLFPKRFLTVELESEYSRTFEQLENVTDLTENLVSTWTNKEFRGTVTEHGFKLISSEIGRGAVCVFIGNFKNNMGTIEIRIHKAFQILFGIILSYPLIGFGLILFGEGIISALQFIPVLIVVFLVFRYLFIGLTFKFVSKTGLNKLTRTLSIKNLNDEA
jgi:hypothetical protein